MRKMWRRDMRGEEKAVNVTDALEKAGTKKH